MTSPYQKAYHKIKARREEVKPQPIWGSWGRFYDRLFNLQGKLVLDFGSDVEAPLYEKFLRDNEGKNGKYKGYDISEDAISWLKGQGYYYDFYTDNSLQGSFDIIIASEVYEHLTEPERERFLSRAHKPIALEDEAAYFETFGFKVQLYIGGRTAPYRPMLWSLWRFLANLALGFYPFHVALLLATKIS